MIKSIKTQNFETHLDMEIDLHPGVNTFVGESDEGKSGIIRQLKWNAQNRPMGDGFRNDQLDPKKKEDKLKATVVGVDYKDAGFVVRARDGFAGGVNHYQIDDTEPLRALRTDVPDEVKDITRMKSVNIQGQHPTEQYFLLADKPGQVAKEFNKVAGLTVMDAAIKDINSQVRTCNIAISMTEKDIKACVAEIEDSEWVDKAEKFAKKLEGFQKKLIKKETEKETISQAVSLIEGIDTKLQTYDGISAAKIALGVLETQKKAINDKKRSTNQLSELILAMKTVDSKLSTYTDIDKALKMLKSLDLLDDKMHKVDMDLDAVTSLLVRLADNEKALTASEIDLKETQKEYDIIRTEQNCPTCGRKGI